MAWIESHQSLANNKKTLRVARRLSISKVTVVGHMQFFWWWCVDNVADGCLTSIERADIADAVCWEGDPDEFFNALIYAEFIDEKDGAFYVHDWQQYIGKLLERRDKDAQRKRAGRGHPPDIDEYPWDGAYIPEDIQRTSNGRTQEVRKESARTQPTVPNHTNRTQPTQPTVKDPPSPPVGGTGAAGAGGDEPAVVPEKMFWDAHDTAKSTREMAGKCAQSAMAKFCVAYKRRFGKQYHPGDNEGNILGRVMWLNGSAVFEGAMPAYFACNEPFVAETMMHSASHFAKDFNKWLATSEGRGEEPESRLMDDPEVRAQVEAAQAAAAKFGRWK